MKAFLHKKYGANYAGQVLTNVEKGSIPSGVAEMYEDDDVTPNDVIRPDDPLGGHPLAVKDDSIDVKHVKRMSEEQADKIKAAEQGHDAAGEVAERIAEEENQTQKAAREADLLAARRSGGRAIPASAGRGPAAAGRRGARKVARKGATRKLKPKGPKAPKAELSE